MNNFKVTIKDDAVSDWNEYLHDNDPLNNWWTALMIDISNGHVWADNIYGKNSWNRYHSDTVFHLGEYILNCYLYNVHFEIDEPMSEDDIIDAAICFYDDYINGRQCAMGYHANV